MLIPHEPLGDDIREEINIGMTIRLLKLTSDEEANSTILLSPDESNST